jgi:hypothetical protein
LGTTKDVEDVMVIKNCFPTIALRVNYAETAEKTL